MGAKSFWLENLQELHNIYSERAQSQNELVPRSMKDSIQEVLIPIGIVHCHSKVLDKLLEIIIYREINTMFTLMVIYM